MKKTLLILTTLIGSMTFAQDCSDLFISEYVEGKFNNRALEIYNPTANTIDLTQYQITRYSGGTTSPAANYTVDLVGTIAPYSTHVGVVDKQDPAGTGFEAPVWDTLAMKADAWYSPVYSTSPCWYWNGDDGIALTKNGTATLVDFFGKLGEDPGVAWTTMGPNYIGTDGGVEVTKDHSLIRKSTILTGDINPSDIFNPLAEYDSIPWAYTVITPIDTTIIGNWSTLGSHSCDCAPLAVGENTLSNVSIYPNPSNGTFYIKGINDFSNIEIVNSLGQTVKTIAINSSSVVKLSMNGHHGVYFVRLSSKNGEIITKRIIVK